MNICVKARGAYRSLRAYYFRATCELIKVGRLGPETFRVAEENESRRQRESENKNRSSGPVASLTLVYVPRIKRSSSHKSVRRWNMHKNRDFFYSFFLSRFFRFLKALSASHRVFAPNFD